MRTLGKVILGLFAAVGLLTVVFFAGMFYLAAHIGGAKSAHAPIASQAVLTINLDDNFVEGDTGRRLEGLGIRSFVSLQDALLAIRRAKTDSRIVAIKANMSDQSLGIAQIQEIRDAIADFRTSGKPAFLYSETIGEGEGALPSYYLAAAFGDIWVQPSGSVGIAGIGTEQLFFKKLLERFGVHATFFGRKEYKSAPEQFTNASMSPANREETTALVGAWFDQMTNGIATDRKLDISAVKSLVDEGPELANEALKNHLVDHIGYRDEFDAATKGATKDAADVSLARYVTDDGGDKGSSHKRVALIHAIGEIDRATGDESAFSQTGIHAEQTAKAIHKAATDKDIDALLVRIDSPGGSYVASDTIWREVVKAREAHKLVVVSMGDTAASGGYFIAMAANHIFADPATVTGSIGVFTGKFVIDRALDKYEVGHERVTFGASAGMYAMTSDFTPKDAENINRMLDATYADFTSKAAQGRGKTQEEIEKVAHGRVWTGTDALKVGLVDELGGFMKAVDYVKAQIGVPAADTVTLVSFPAHEEPWWALFKALGDGDMPFDTLLGKSSWVGTTFGPLITALSETHATAHGPQAYMEPLKAN